MAIGLLLPLHRHSLRAITRDFWRASNRPCRCPGRLGSLGLNLIMHRRPAVFMPNSTRSKTPPLPTNMPAAADHPVLSRLLSSNAQWSKDVASVEPQFFEKSAKGQAPKVLWIGCADSRVPESVILACKPGEIFVHRNIANQFHLDDDSARSVLTYAVDHLGVEHVIVVGHTACGGVAACYQNAQKLGTANGNTQASGSTPLERWLSPLTELTASLKVTSKAAQEALPFIVEENVKAQVANVVKTDTITAAWAAGKSVYVHGWVYVVEEGRLRDLQISQGPTQSEV